MNKRPTKEQTIQALFNIHMYDSASQHIVKEYIQTHRTRITNGDCIRWAINLLGEILGGCSLGNAMYAIYVKIEITTKPPYDPSGTLFGQ